MSDPLSQVKQQINQGVKDVKAHPFRNIFIGIVIGIILSGSIFGYFYLDSIGKSSKLIGQFEQRQQSVIATIGGLDDSIRSSQSTSSSIKAIVARDGEIIKALRTIVNILTDGK